LAHRSIPRTFADTIPGRLAPRRRLSAIPAAGG
jgi:hypothetical protein